MVYVLIFKPDEPLEIIGPFLDDESPSDYGKAWQKEHDDCPCWQVINIPIVIFKPVG